MNKLTIAIDFDGTLFWCFGLGGTEQKVVPNSPLIAACKHWKELGHTLILWTCREAGNGLEEAIALCANEGLTFDFVNENSTEIIKSCGNRRKIVADIYIDDKAVRMTTDAWETWTKHVFELHNAIF